MVTIGDGRRVGLPLDAVIRLERMTAQRVERVGHREVVQYRGELLPLTRLDQVLGAFGAEEQEEDSEAFADKMARLTTQLAEQFGESTKLEAEIKKNLAELGYGF